MNSTDVKQLILDKLNIIDLLEHYEFENINDNNDIIRACCKIHNGDNPTSFVINKEGLWHCHSSQCGNGDIFTLVQIMEGFDDKSAFPKSINWLLNFLNINTNQQYTPKPKYLKETQQYINHISKNQDITFEEYNINEEIKKVSKFRNFKKETLNFFRLGYVDEITLTKKNNKQYTLYNRLVFPIILNNIQVGVSLRRTNNKDYPKWSHQPYNIKTSNILYNYDNVLNKKQIVICEGITDVWAFYEINIPAVSIFGTNISYQQYKSLLQISADIIFAFDNDKAGINATNKAIKLLTNKANLSYIQLPLNKDPENIKREVLLQLYEQRRNC